MTTKTSSFHRHRQPILSDATVVIAAPTQLWSRDNGECTQPIDGLYWGDIRHLGGVSLTALGSAIEWVSCAQASASDVSFMGLLRDLDDDTSDPKLRLIRHRQVTGTGLREVLRVESHHLEPMEVTLRLEVRADFSPMSKIKDGRTSTTDPIVEIMQNGASASLGSARADLNYPNAAVRGTGNHIEATWQIVVPPLGSASAEWSAALDDADSPVRPATSTWGDLPTDNLDHASGDYLRWAETAWSDLGGLRLTLPGSPDEFIAAGAPWFFTLFGRDSLWAARLLLPAKTDLALSTLRVLARLQGTKKDPITAEAPGKILHELRASSFVIPDEGVELPPVYYGSVDSTLLWILVLADAWKAGAPTDQVVDLIPALRGALHWMLTYGDGDGDGFLDYIDESGTGLSNQGWKDSGDSIQWKDGSIATAPIALSEVQAYAYEAALAGAELLESLSSDAPATLGKEITSSQLRAWASAMKARFAQAFWVETDEGRYPAIALDRDKRPVDTLTSNAGHLLGTGLLDEHEETLIAQHLVSPSMLSGFGVRTLSSGAGGFWPLSYHGGSVWTHDTAIILRGMKRAGLDEFADQVRENLRRAAVSFNYRLPELHSGDGLDATSKARPYPASCKPQAWSAASAFVCVQP